MKKINHFCVKVVRVTAVWIAVLCHLVESTSSSLSTSLDKQVKTFDIQAVEGKIAEFPCDVTSADQDKVHMVFWFRDDVGIPLYSFDVRGVGMSEGRHWSAPGVFGPRAHFRATPSPAALLLQDVKRHDEGIYRCRVDFRNSQTISFRFNLTVIVPPGNPVVVERTGGVLEGSKIGPKEEGDDLMLTCRVRGGRPSPTVRWLVNGILVDVEYEHNTGDLTENRLSWPAIGRQDLSSTFTCQATNSILVEPKEVSFVLEMNLRPLTADMERPQVIMQAEKRYPIICKSSGSRPNAVITWYKGKKQLRKAKEETKDNITISELSFVPTAEDDGKPLICKAENTMLGLSMETVWKIEVVYPPLINLKLGSTLSAEDIKEGDDVYFECHVHSNPPWRKLHWMHNNNILNHNISARIVRSNQSLVLQKVARHSAGRYSCSATNSEGETVSNQFVLRVKFAPMCKAVGGGVVAVGAARGERVLVLCDVDADPPARSFKWKFNNSGETLDVGADRYTSNGSSSILRYTPVTDLDFGTLSCSAGNDVGHQAVPCIFQIVAAGKPQPLSNCSLSNYTGEISCEAGYDGGLPQYFLLEIYSGSNPHPVYNMTSEVAVFSWPLEALEALGEPFSNDIIPGSSLRLEVFAVNAKGRSTPATLTGLRLGDAEKQAAVHSSMRISAGWGALLGGLLSVIVLGTLIFLKARRSRNRRETPAATPAPQGKRWPPPEPKIRALENTDDRDPDLIPATYEPASLYARTWGTNEMVKDTISMPENRETSATPLQDLPSTRQLPIPGPPLIRSPITSSQYAPDNCLNLQAFKDKLLDTRLPESCV